MGWQDLYFLTLISGWNCTVPEKSATTKLENNKAIQDKRFCLKEKKDLLLPEKGSDFEKKWRLVKFCAYLFFKWPWLPKELLLLPSKWLVLLQPSYNFSFLCVVWHRKTQSENSRWKFGLLWLPILFSDLGCHRSCCCCQNLLSQNCDIKTPSVGWENNYPSLFRLWLSSYIF